MTEPIDCAWSLVKLTVSPFTRLPFASRTVAVAVAVDVPLAVIVLGPLFPYALARIGLRRAILAGIVLAMLIQELMPLLPGVPAWLALRFLTGCGLGLSWIASEVWMNQIADERSRGLKDDQRWSKLLNRWAEWNILLGHNETRMKASLKTMGIEEIPPTVSFSPN